MFYPATNIKIRLPRKRLRFSVLFSCSVLAVILMDFFHMFGAKNRRISLKEINIHDVIEIFYCDSIFTKSYQEWQYPEIEDNQVDLKGFEEYLEQAECLLQKKTIIPVDILQNITNIIQEDAFSLPDCQRNEHDKKQRFAFLKLHYTCGETTSNILRRFSLKNDLSVILPELQKNTIGWPHQPEPIMYLPHRVQGGFDALMDYVIFNRSYLHNLLPPSNTVYMTMVRKPENRLVPVLQDYLDQGCSLMPDEIKNNGLIREAVLEFLNHKVKYDSIYSSSENIDIKRHCFCLYGVSLLQNSMAFDLGFPTGYHMKPSKQTDNYGYISQWLDQLIKDIPVIMVSESFNLSLVLLKRYMCWSFKDIMYLGDDVGSSTSNGLKDYFPDEDSYPEELVKSFEQWSNVDTLLYILLNNTFWSRIKAVGQDILEETEVFEMQKDMIGEFCSDILENSSGRSTVLDVPGNKFDPGYQIYSDECEFLTSDSGDKLMKKLLVEYHRQPIDDVVQPQPYNKGRFQYQWC